MWVGVCVRRIGACACIYVCGNWAYLHCAYCYTTLVLTHTRNRCTIDWLVQTSKCHLVSLTCLLGIFVKICPKVCFQVNRCFIRHKHIYMHIQDRMCAFTFKPHHKKMANGLIHSKKITRFALSDFGEWADEGIWKFYRAEFILRCIFYERFKYEFFPHSFMYSDLGPEHYIFFCMYDFYFMRVI